MSGGQRPHRARRKLMDAVGIAAGKRHRRRQAPPTPASGGRAARINPNSPNGDGQSPSHHCRIVILKMWSKQGSQARSADRFTSHGERKVNIWPNSRAQLAKCLVTGGLPGCLRLDGGQRGRSGHVRSARPAAISRGRGRSPGTSRAAAGATASRSSPCRSAKRVGDRLAGRRDRRGRVAMRAADRLGTISSMMPKRTQVLRR